MTLLSDFLIKSDIITDTAAAAATEAGITWFEGMTFNVILQNIIIPVLGLLVFCFFLKNRYRGMVEDGYSFP